jgi:transaldolase|tara:strand:- start:1339 stop:2052 length:714 start_codon:yes stop_codon:yes gene_type:complete
MINNKIKIFADGADYKSILNFNKKNFIKGLTTNPTLMKKSGVKNYSEFAKKILKKVTIKPISFEVFADDEKSMYKQAKEISTWGKNVYVKIPVTNTRGVGCYNLIKKLSNENIKLNVTAIFTNNQVTKVINSLNMNTKSIISIFAGRIADTGIDPSLLISFCLKNLKLKKNKKCEVLWASTREIYSIIAAEKLGCHIITVPNNILSKINLIGKNLNSYSLETIKDFYKDAKSAGFKI